jgi:hypothetical protein
MKSLIGPIGAQQISYYVFMLLGSSTYSILSKLVLLCLYLWLQRLLGFGANNKNYYLRNPKLPKIYLCSNSNVVTINGDSVTYPCRLNAGIMLSHKH